DQQAREYWFASQWPEAAKTYQELVEQNPQDALLRLRLGVSQMRTSRWPEALANLEQALRLGRDDSETYALLGPPQLQLKQAAQAARSYAEALARGVHQWETRYNFACACALAGEKDKALAALEQAFAEDRGDLQHALLDPDLLSLRNEPRFRALFR